MSKIKISLGSKFALAFAVLFITTILAVMLAVRATVVARFTAQYDDVVAASVLSFQTNLSARQRQLDESLKQLANQIRQDRDFRLNVLVNRTLHEPYVINYAQEYMATLGLQALEIADPNGVVLSSGHDPFSAGKDIGLVLQQLLSADGKITLIPIRNARKEFHCIAAVEPIRFGSQTYYVLGGFEISAQFLTELKDDPSELVFFEIGEQIIGTSSSADVSTLLSNSHANTGLSLPERQSDLYSVGELKLDLLTGEQITELRGYLLHPRTELVQLLDSLNRRILVIAVLGLLFAIAFSVAVTRSVAKPLRRLAQAAGDLSLETLDAKFDVGGNDEVGVLNDALYRMLGRLRQSRLKLASAEKKAAFAEIARQVNHDIKNGFIPIRHVMRHWEETAEKEPNDLVRVFGERKSSITDSVDYLESLARNYSRLRPEVSLKSIDVNRALDRLLQNYLHLPNAKVHIETFYDTGPMETKADALQLHRAFENIMSNALDAVGQEGRISISTRLRAEGILVTWRDNGCGISEEIRARLFQPHVTTKPEGSGLGLCNVKRIIEDFGGDVRIESELGVGTTVYIMLPKLEK